MILQIIVSLGELRFSSILKVSFTNLNHDIRVVLNVLNETILSHLEESVEILIVSDSCPQSLCIINSCMSNVIFQDINSNLFTIVRLSILLDEFFNFILHFLANSVFSILQILIINFAEEIERHLLHIACMSLDVVVNSVFEVLFKTVRIVNDSLLNSHQILRISISTAQIINDLLGGELTGSILSLDSVRNSGDGRLNRGNFITIS